jgi:hypothetical protein
MEEGVRPRIVMAPLEAPHDEGFAGTAVMTGIALTVTVIDALNPSHKVAAFTWPT